MVTESPEHDWVEDALIVGVGALLTFTVTSEEVAEHPLASVTVTL